ncbi:MAG: SNARE associated Golgi protein-related protein [Bacteroidetes bacterium 38_7]|nr:MAG: SNARE associated Golgi protein-related protein [Bacteroidetes bacterium 38_7]HAL65451.1 DedA family protein [Bacteroidales bacterium]
MHKKFFILILLTFQLLILKAKPQAEAVSPENLSLLKRIELWYEKNMNYGSITVLMALESSFIPFPSEIIIPPAAYIASKPGSKLNIILIVIFGTLGALIGACINYFLALWLGRPLMYKLADSKVGKILLLSSAKIQKAENYFNEHGNISTFIGRLIPGIRQLISLPAGLARMNLLSFILFTALGATTWNIILALLGYIAHGQADLIEKYNKELSYIILAIVGLVALFYIFKYVRKRLKSVKQLPS